jgi:hypothetical protein
MDGVGDESNKFLSFPRLLGGMFSAKTSLSRHCDRQPCPIAENNIMHSSLSASHPANCRIQPVNVCYGAENAS